MSKIVKNCFYCCLFFIFSGCRLFYSDPELVSFSVLKENNKDLLSDSEGDIDEYTITVKLPNRIDLSSIVVDFEINGTDEDNSAWSHTDSNFQELTSGLTPIDFTRGWVGLIINPQFFEDDIIFSKSWDLKIGYSVDSGLFPDMNLYNSLKSSLDKTDIYTYDLNDVDALYLYNEVTDYSGIEYLINLKSLLIIYPNNLDFLNKLHGSLYSLSLGLDGSVTDFSPVGYLQNLTYLEILSPIEDTVFLSKLKKLDSLIFGDCGITDIASISSCSSLRMLNLSDNPVDDFSYLSDLTNLNDLRLDNSGITDLTFINSLTNINYLIIDQNDIINISPLRNLTKLEYLTADVNSIQDLSPLANLINLQSLSLGDNSIEEIKYLSGLKRLTSLSLGINNISDISWLSKLTDLTNLYLYSNNISDVSALSTLKKLKSLYLNNNDISDISGLAGLKALTTLTLRYNNISDISVLSNLNGLSHLDVMYNGMDLTSETGTANLSVINQLIANGCTVNYRNGNITD